MTRVLRFPEEPVGSVKEITGGREQPAAGVVSAEGDGPVRLVLERNLIDDSRS